LGWVCWVPHPLRDRDALKKINGVHKRLSKYILDTLWTNYVSDYLSLIKKVRRPKYGMCCWSRSAISRVLYRKSTPSQKLHWGGVRVADHKAKGPEFESQWRQLISEKNNGKWKAEQNSTEQNRNSFIISSRSAVKYNAIIIQ